MAKLVATQNPEVLKRLLPYWRKYIAKASNKEAELMILWQAFNPETPHTFFVLADDNGIYGYAVASVDKEYNALFCYQVGTDRHDLMKQALINLANGLGATTIYFNTERNNRAWERLIGCRTVGYVMEIPFDGGVKHGRVD